MTIDEMQELALKNGCDVRVDKKRGVAVLNKIAVEADTVELPLDKLAGITPTNFEENYLPEPLGARL